MKRLLIGASAAALFFFPSIAAANDGFAGIDAGGITFAKTDAVTMAKEELFISLDEVRVSYVFKNITANDVTGEVAFPLPPFMISIMLESDTDDRLSSGDEFNVLGFTALVDGKPVSLSADAQYRLPSYDTEGRITSERDVTQRLKSLGVPTTYNAETVIAWFATLPAETQKALIAEGLFYEASEPGRYAPAYSVSAIFHWTQTFPANSEVRIAHSYRPMPSGSVPGVWPDLEAQYCIDEGTKRGIEKTLAPLGTEAGEGMMVVQYYLSYILSTANSWAGPIGDFTLTLDKGDPTSIISLCMDGIEKTGPTTFRVHKTNFKPERDLQIYLLKAEKTE
ncbi:MAG: DUF4424 family protein [Alphaproteobacteria bacterium]|nr:DUF4424 family protein [Alphaproteobacteria bacterium]